MPAGLFDDITNALKIAYPPKAIEPMVNEETPFRKQLKKMIPSGGRVNEAIVKFGANFNPPQNQGQLIDGGALPSPKNRTEDQFTLKPTIFAGGFQIGWVTKAAGNSNKAAFNGGELRRRTEETLSDLAKFIEQTYLGTHGTGRRARVEANVSNSATCVAALPEGARLLRENQYYTIRTTDGGATAGTGADFLRLTNIAQSTRTLTFVDGTSGSAAALTVSAGTHIHPVILSGQSFVTSPFANGVRGLVDDATFLSTLHGLARATYSKLNANVSSNGGTLRNLTEQILVRACHENRARSGKTPTDAWMGEGQAEKYIEFVAPDRRYTVAGKGVQGMGTGYQEGSLVHYFPGGQLKLQISYDLVAREVYLLNRDTFFHYLAQDMDWWDDGGGMLKPTPATTTYSASWLAFLRSIENIGCDMPIANTVIRDLKDPAVGDL